MSRCPRLHELEPDELWTVGTPTIVQCQLPQSHPGLHRWETVLEWRDPRDERGQEVRA